MNEVQRLECMSGKMNENERTDFEGQVAIVSGGAELELDGEVGSSFGSSFQGKWYF